MEKRIKPDGKGAAGGCVKPSLDVVSKSNKSPEIKNKPRPTAFECVEQPTPTTVDAPLASQPRGETREGSNIPPNVPVQDKTENSEIPAAQTHRFWKDVHLPADFAEINFTTVEEPLRKLVHLSDQWAEDQLGEPPTHFADVPLNALQQTVDEWWTEQQPAIHVNLWSYVKNYLAQEAGQESHRYPECLSEALERLIQSGTNADAQLAIAGKELRNARDYKRVGEANPEMFVTWGEKIQCIDYNAWGISFGKLHFVSIDMGDTIPLTTNLRHALSTPETQEKSQCVILHLALGIEWCGPHCAKRVPSKTRVMQLASQLRVEEYKQAQSCLKAIRPRLPRNHSSYGKEHMMS